MDAEKIDRINALYHKSQSVGLTEEEKNEQAALRKEYIEAVRRNLRGSLNNISIKEKDEDHHRSWKEVWKCGTHRKLI